MLEELLEEYKRLIDGWKIAHATKLERRRIIQFTNLERWIVTVSFLLGLSIVLFCILKYDKTSKESELYETLKWLIFACFSYFIVKFDKKGKNILYRKDIPTSDIEKKEVMINILRDKFKIKLKKSDIWCLIEMIRDNLDSSKVTIHIINPATSYIMFVIIGLIPIWILKKPQEVTLFLITITSMFVVYKKLLEPEINRNYYELKTIKDLLYKIYLFDCNE